MNINILDLIFLIPLAIFAIQGFRKGIIIEIFSIVALIFAIIGSMKLTQTVVSIIGLEKSPWGMYVAYILVFIGIFAGIIFLAKLVEKIIKTAQLNIFNRISGAVFGAFKTIFIFSLFIWISDQVNIFPQTVKEASLCYKFIKPIAPKIISFITDNLDIAKGIINQIERIFGKIPVKV